MSDTESIVPSAEAGQAGRKNLLASGGAVLTAFAASLCCIGPVLFVTLGVGASLASTLEPLRPFFTLMTVGILGFAFYSVYGRPRATVGAKTSEMSDASCAVPRKDRRDKVILWVATIIAAVLLSFPQWSKLLV